ncbi:MAG: N-6 DNA methylase [Planctomycetaceae bacterium]|jgi:type I restriction-modification system DNA methylase subunit|nr:N-6 DNA methylase [Planctomycetaceae bacterium]
MFQQIILKKYIESNADKIHLAFERYVLFFHDAERQAYIRQCIESQFQEGFLRELFVNVLGYTLIPDPNYNLIPEGKNETDAGRADGIIFINNDVRAVIELKDIRTIDLKLVEKQAFNYKYQHKNAAYVITSNFEKLRFYIDNAVEYFEWNLFTLTENQFAELWICLAYENIVDDLPKKLKNETISREDEITKEFYNVYKQFKNSLFSDLIANNSQHDKLTLFSCSQKILDRLVFILFSEDCGLLPPNTIKKIIREWKILEDADEYRPLYTHLQKYFSYLDSGGKGKNQNIFGYNGGLFQPNKLLDSLKISDSTLVERLNKLSDYNYRSDVNVDILGHIFENSLAEIEKLKYELSGLESYELRETNKRKKDGIFYTPRYITSYIISSTLGKLCDEKKIELGLDKEELFDQIIEQNGKTNNKLNGKSNGKQKKVTSNPILEKLEKYRQWLLSLSICDPACGSGAFLNAALDFLKEEHYFIDKLTAQILGHSIVFSEYEISILENNLFGVDVNEESVEITKLALWLRTAKPNRKLNFLDANIKCGNSLISDPKIDPDKSFDWRKEFPRIFEKGGFDVVIGNPPYVFSRSGKFSEIEKEYYYSRYPLSNYQLNTYLLFIDLAYYHLLHDNGVFGFIVPNNCLTIDTFQPFRKFLLEQTGDIEIVNIINGVFSDANVDNCIITFKKQNADKISIGEMNNEKLTKIGTFPASIFAKEQYIINIAIAKKPEVVQLMKKIELTAEPLERHAVVSTGIKAYQDGKGKPSQTTQMKESRIYHSRQQTTDEFIKYLDGKDVSRYLLSWSGEYVRYGDWLAEPRRSVDFSAQRILVRQIPSQPPYCINAVFINALAINDINSMIIFNFNIDPLYLLGILNSRLMSFWFINKFDKFQRGIFPQFKVKELSLFPIAVCNKEKQKQLVGLVDKITSLQNSIQLKRQKFLRRVTDNLGNIQPLGVLEYFDRLKFKEFLELLSKRKIKLRLNAQAEWEDFFNENQILCRNIVKQITETDNEIDQLVYELYGLTEDEIKFIEG